MTNDNDRTHLVAGKYGIEDLVDLGALTRTFKKFSMATGFTTGFLAYPSQKILIKTGWRDACVKFHRACPASAECCKESNVELSRNLQAHRKLSIRPCRLGLVDGATPISVRGVYLAYLSTGQVFFKPPDLARYRRYARQFGFDAKEYLKAIRAVPVVTEAQFRTVLAYLSEIATQVAEQGVVLLEKHDQHTQLRAVITAHTQTEVALGESLEQYRDLFESSRDAIMTLTPPAWRFTAANPATVQMFGAPTEAEFVACAPWDLSPDRQPDGRASAEKALEMIAMALRAGSHSFEWTHRRFGGEEFQADVLLTKMERAGQIVIQATVRDITDRTRAEAARRQAEERFRILFEQAGDSILLLEIAPDGIPIIRDANSATFRVLGYDRAELIGQPLAAILTEADPAQAIAQRRQTLLAGTGKIFETQHRCKDGTLRDFECTVSEIHLGSQTFGVSIERDITERKRLAAELRESERRFRTLVENLSEAIALLGPDGRFLYATPSVARINGYSPDEFMGRNAFEIIHPEDRPQLAQHFQQIQQTPNASIAIRFRLQHRDGSWRTMAALATNQLGDPAIGAIVVNYQDITEAQQAEAQLRRAKEDWERTFDAMPDLVCILDANYTIVRANRAMAAKLGVTPAQAAGLTCYEVIHGLHCPPDFCPHAKMLLSRQEQAAEIHEDRLGGDFLITCTPMLNEAGELLGSVHVAHDITARKQAEVALRALAVRMQTLREDESRTLARELHDQVGQGMTAVMMDLAWLGKQLPATLQERLESMRQQMGATIMTVQRISRELRPGMLDHLGLAATIEWQAAEFERRTGIKCTVTTTATENISREVTTALFRIFQETLTNIARHANAQHIVIRLTEAAGDVILEVTDDGRGITPAEIASPLSLGLLGMRERAAAVGGEIRLAGTAGTGTTLTVHVPAAAYASPS